MNWDPWTLTVLALVVLSLMRPSWATLAQRHGPRAARRKYNPMRASGGAAMLAMAVYLMIESSQVTGRGYWDLARVAVDDPFMRTLPVVWVPAVCWVLLVVPGLWWLYAGIRGARPQRNAMAAIWALNEIAAFSVLLILGVYVPEGWAQASFINFGLEGIYVSFLVGAVLRFILILLNYGGGTTQQLDSHLDRPGSTWLGRLRRY